MIGCAAFLAITGILTFIGVVYALKRKMWALVIIGSIASIVSESLLGIPRTIIAVISNKEYS